MHLYITYFQTTLSLSSRPNRTLFQNSKIVISIQNGEYVLVKNRLDGVIRRFSSNEEMFDWLLSNVQTLDNRSFASVYFNAARGEVPVHQGSLLLRGSIESTIDNVFKIISRFDPRPEHSFEATDLRAFAA